MLRATTGKRTCRKLTWGEFYALEAERAQFIELGWRPPPLPGRSRYPGG